MTITTRSYKLLPITGGSQIPTCSTRFPPNADFVSSPMGMAILAGELIVLVGGRFTDLEEEKKEEELAIPWRRCFERAGTGQPGVEQVVKQGGRAFDVERDPLIEDDYPEEYVEECPRGWLTPSPTSFLSVLNFTNQCSQPPTITNHHHHHYPPVHRSSLSVAQRIFAPSFCARSKIRFKVFPPARYSLAHHCRAKSPNSAFRGTPRGADCPIPPRADRHCSRRGVRAGDYAGLALVRGRECEVLRDLGRVSLSGILGCLGKRD